MGNEALTVLNSNQALQMGGVGMGASMFRARPSMIELVHKSSRAENVQYGQFRVVSSNEHLGTTIRVVLLAVPQLQREWFVDKNTFSKDNKGCFSLDGIQPHPRASQPPAMYCATCPKGDSNWVKWRQTKDPNDLPPCSAYWHLLIADRATQTPYYLNIKGTSFLPFKQAMEQQMSGLLAKLLANAKAENKARGYTYIAAEGKFVSTPGFILPEGKAQESPVPLPNIFNISFDITSSSKAGGPFVMSFGKFALMKAEDIAEFGNLYVDLLKQKEEAQQQYTEQAEGDAMVTEIQPASKAEVLQGEVVSSKEPITI